MCPAATFVLMPKATVNEEDMPQARENEVWHTREVPPV